MNLDSEELHQNGTIFDAFVKADSVLNQSGYGNVAVSISGGADSDIILDMVWRVTDDASKVRYVWFDTGLEYQATKDHLTDLEEKYGIVIERVRAEKPIPLSCKLYGQPFLGKFTSQMIGRLQDHGYDWKERSYEEAIGLYPNCKGALGWFYSAYGDKTNFSYSRFNSNSYPYLHRFMTENPPWFKISDKCCTYAKKNVSKEYIKENGIDLMVLGIRKAEGGIRANTKTCFSVKGNHAEYRPIFWFKDQDKEDYERTFMVTHSRCYTEYGFKRTGCAGCPFGRGYEKQFDMMKRYEPKLYRAVQSVFKDSYEYTRRFREFQKQMKSSV